MTKVISEGYNGLNDNGFMNESLISFDMNELSRYVTHNDKRIKNICESLELNIADDYSNVSVDRMNKLISIKEGNETLKLFLKKSLVEDMDNYFRLKF